MENTFIRIAQAPADVPLIAALAEQTWAPTYQHIVSPEQLQYMFTKIYHPAALQKQMAAGQVFLLLYQKKLPAGFAAYSPQPTAGVFKLNKLYVTPACHGRGYGKLLVEAVQEKVKTAGGQLLELNVNRHNPARAFYQKCGFAVVRAEDVPIGPYWMNDYVMQKAIY